MPNIPSGILVKIVLPVVLALITVGGVVLGVEERYVTQKEAATSLQAFDQAVKKDLVHLELQILNTTLESLTDQYHKQRQILKTDPTDLELREEFERIKARREIIQQRIDNKLEIQ